MAIYAISDLHLSLSKPKPMDIFGPAWVDHAVKIARNWDSLVKEEDVVLVPGDTSWAMRLSDAMPDLEFVAERPGKKILIRGNHDYWWQRKATSRIRRSVHPSLTLLQGNSIMVDSIGITGTRGWRADWELRDMVNAHVTASQNAERPGHSHSDPAGTRDDRSLEQEERILRREILYLEQGIASIPDSTSLKIVMLHFPPFNERLELNDFARMLTRHYVDILVYGHVHLGLGGWLEGLINGVEYHMVSADAVGFTPQLIVP